MSPVANGAPTKPQARPANNESPQSAINVRFMTAFESCRLESTASFNADFVQVYNVNPFDKGSRVRSAFADVTALAQLNSVRKV